MGGEKVCVKVREVDRKGEALGVAVDCQLWWLCKCDAGPCLC